MADTTISFKVEEEIREKAQNLIKASGITGKEWFNKVVAMAEMQSVKEGATDFASDLGELEIHTTRIYELVANMVQKSIYLKENAIETLEQQLEQQREITSDYQLRVKAANEERNQALEEAEASRLEQNQLLEQLNEVRETLETNKLLVEEYKSKNDTLNGLVTKYESYAVENEQLKETLANERSLHQSKIDELTHHNNELTSKIKDLEQQLKNQNEAHENAIERLKERLEVEQEKALLQAERQHQKALVDANNAYSEKIQTLYDNMDKQRQSYEEKINELQRQLDDERKNNKKK